MKQIDEKRYYELRQFFGTQFHQDAGLSLKRLPQDPPELIVEQLPLEELTDRILDEYRTDRSTKESRKLVLDQLAQLQKEGLSDEELRWVVEGFGYDFIFPENKTMTEWLSEIVSKLSKD